MTASKQANKRASEAVFDFATLKQAQKAEISGVSRTTALDAAPGVLAAVRESWADGEDGKQEARAFTVPNAAAPKLVRLIRDAAERIGCGVRVVEDTTDKDNTKVTFIAKRRKQRKPKDETTETAAQS